MTEANFILKTQENMRMPKDEKANTVKKVVLIIIAILLVGSIVLGSNLFGELSWITQVILVTAFAGTLFTGGSKFVPFPIELRFYDDRLEIYRTFVYYGKNKSRKETYIFKYADIQQCVFNKSSNRMMIKGQVYVEWFNYNKAGVVSQTPDIAKTDMGLCYFYTNADPSVDFVKEIQEHSPINVTVE